MGKAETVFSDTELPENDRLLVKLYRETGLTVDELAYSDEFEEIYRRLQEIGDQRSKGQVYRRLLNLRKAGWLPRVA